MKFRASRPTRSEAPPDRGSVDSTAPVSNRSSANNPFAAERDWLERKRRECLRDVADLKSRLDTVAAAPWEERPDQLNSILRQAAGAYRSLERIDTLKSWVDP